MRARPFSVVLLLAGMFVVAASASAHHNPKPMYEANNIMLMGTVTEYEFANPHSIISIVVRTDSGATEEWHAEFLPPSEMIRAGWSKETLKPGDQVTMTGRPGRHAQRIMWLETLVTPDGRKLGRKP